MLHCCIHSSFTNVLVVNLIFKAKPLNQISKVICYGYIKFVPDFWHGNLMFL